MAQAYLRTGEFAALCGVTKHTLFHYDDIGLLCPVKVDERGYRYYSVYQAYTFDIIRILRSMGMSLADIKDYVQNRDVHAFLSLLTETDDRLQREIERLQRLRVSLTQTLEVTEESFHAVIGKLQYVPRREAYFIVTAAPPDDDAKAMATALSEHIAYCRSQYGYHTFTGGEIIPAAQIAADTFRAAWYSTEIPAAVADETLHRKPAGMYAVQYVRSSYDVLQRYYRAFIAAVRQAGYEPVGALYQEDVRNYIVETDHTQYVMKLEVAIKRAAHTGKTRQDSL